MPGSGRAPGEEHGNPLQYSCLENLHGQRDLKGYSPWGRKKSDATQQLSPAQEAGYTNGNENFRLMGEYQFKKVVRALVV